MSTITRRLVGNHLLAASFAAASLVLMIGGLA